MVQTNERDSQRAARMGDGEPGSLVPNVVIAKWLRRAAHLHQTVVVSALLALRIAAELEQETPDRTTQK